MVLLDELYKEFNSTHTITCRNCRRLCVLQARACPSDNSSPDQSRIIKVGPNVQNHKVPLLCVCVCVGGGGGWGGGLFSLAGLQLLFLACRHLNLYLV